MTYGLDLTEEFKGVKYYGREVGVLQGGKVEVLVMFEETLGDVLSPYCSGLKDSDPDYELAISIDDGIFVTFLQKYYSMMTNMFVNGATNMI